MGCVSLSVVVGGRQERLVVQCGGERILPAGHTTKLITDTTNSILLSFLDIYNTIPLIHYTITSHGTQSILCVKLIFKKLPELSTFQAADD